MLRICTALSDHGYQVTLIGRKRLKVDPESSYRFKIKRLRLLFKKGKFFYAEINFRLFIKLLFTKCDAICAIDLDTILPCKYASQWKGKKLIYDSHEYFTEQHEIASRPKTKRMWEKIEKKGFKKLKYAYTVCNSFAEIYKSKYQIDFKVIRNFDYLRTVQSTEKDFPSLIYIGAVNAGRGLEETITAMKKTNAKLYICGYGDIIDQLKTQVKNQKLEDKVIFTGSQSPEELRQRLEQATIGLLLLSDLGKSYYYTLANKFCDYVQAEIPQITVPFPEYVALNKEHEVSEFCELDPKLIAETANKLITDQTRYNELKNNCITAKKDWNWEKESEKLIDFYNQVFERDGK